MSLITVAGYAAVLYLVAKLLTYLSKYVRSPLDVNKLGDWSLVTGATDGIGRKNKKYGSVQELRSTFGHLKSIEKLA